MNLVTLYKTIRKRSKGHVKHFRSDWRHDRNWLRNMQAALKSKEVSSMEFVHVSHTSGTHMWPIYRDRLDVVRPYLFGRCTPRQTLIDVASIFDESSTSIESNALIQHYDGQRLETITRRQARHIFMQASSKPQSQVT